MRPVAFFDPWSRAPPGAWALGPTADERAAETAHVRPPPGPQSARSPAGRCRPSDLIRWLPGLLAGSKPASATGRPNPSAISFLLPLLSREERRRRFRPSRGRRRRCRGCLAGARRSPSERAAVEVAVGGALPCSCGLDPLQRESSGNAALGFCRPR